MRSSPLTILDRVSAQQLWDAIMWCCTQEQLQEVAARIRAEYSETPAQREQNAGELDRLRKMYQIRYDLMVDPRGGPVQ